jgi:hypothetical protein
LPDVLSKLHQEQEQLCADQANANCHQKMLRILLHLDFQKAENAVS